MTSDQAHAILQFLIPTVESEHATTRKVLAAVPDGKGDYAPDPKSMSAIDLAWHIASSEHMFMSGPIDGAFPAGDGKRPENVKTSADVLAFYDQGMATIEKLKTLTGEQALKVIDFHGVWQLPSVSWLQMMLGHGIHHRGQLSAYLRPMGAKVPGIYGPSGDEPMKVTASA